MAEISRLEEAYQWNITRLADAFGLHRDTVRKRLRDAGVLPTGKRGGNNTYALKDAGPALFADKYASSVSDPDDLEPNDRKAWYQSENERVKLEKEMRVLVPIEEVHREMSSFAKALDNCLETLPDLLERDAGLDPESINLVERVTDQLREQMFQSVITEDPDDE